MLVSMYNGSYALFSGWIGLIWMGGSEMGGVYFCCYFCPLKFLLMVLKLVSSVALGRLQQVLYLHSGYSSCGGN